MPVIPELRGRSERMLLSGAGEGMDIQSHGRLQVRDMGPQGAGQFHILPLLVKIDLLETKDAYDDHLPRLQVKWERAPCAGPCKPTGVCEAAIGPAGPKLCSRRHHLGLKLALTLESRAHTVKWCSDSVSLRLSGSPG